MVQIFTSEEAELPKESVADFLERLDPATCAKYIEFLIAERGETSQRFHDRLAELYLRMTVSAKRRGDDGMCVWFLRHNIMLTSNCSGSEDYLREAAPLHRYY